MAFIMSFTDSYGEEYADSYWNVAETNLCKATKSGRVLFQGFKDAANKGKRIVGTKDYAVSPDQYDAFFAASVIDPQGVNHLKQAYLLALAVEDTGEESFFASASEA